MSNASNRILDEFAKLATDAAGAAQGIKREVETALCSQVERILSKFDLVQREEFEAVKEMAAKARQENETLGERIKQLEEKLADLPELRGKPRLEGEDG